MSDARTLDLTDLAVWVGGTVKRLGDCTPEDLATVVRDYVLLAAQVDNVRRMAEAQGHATVDAIGEERLRTVLAAELPRLHAAQRRTRQLSGTPTKPKASRPRNRQGPAFKVLPTKEAAEAAFALAVEVGPSEAARRLGCSDETLRRAFIRYGLGRPSQVA